MRQKKHPSKNQGRTNPHAESEAKHSLSNQQPLGKKSEKKVLYHGWDEMGMAAIQLLLSDSKDGDSNKVFV